MFDMYVCMYVCMYKQDLALNNLQELICHKTQPNQTKAVINTTGVIWNNYGCLVNLSIPSNMDFWFLYIQLVKKKK